VICKTLSSIISPLQSSINDIMSFSFAAALILATVPLVTVGHIAIAGRLLQSSEMFVLLLFQMYQLVIAVRPFLL